MTTMVTYNLEPVTTQGKRGCIPEPGLTCMSSRTHSLPNTLHMSPTCAQWIVVPLRSFASSKRVPRARELVHGRMGIPLLRVNTCGLTAVLRSRALRRSVCMPTPSIAFLEHRLSFVHLQISTCQGFLSGLTRKSCFFCIPAWLHASGLCGCRFCCYQAYNRSDVSRSRFTCIAQIHAIYCHVPHAEPDPGPRFYALRSVMTSPALRKFYICMLSIPFQPHLLLPRTLWVVFQPILQTTG